MDTNTLVNTIQYVYQAVFGKLPVIQLAEMDDRSNNPTEAIEVDGGFYLYPTVGEHVTIKGPIPVTHYAVDVAAGGPSIFDVPDVIEIGTYPTLQGAITALITEIAKSNANRASDEFGMAEAYGQA